MYPLSRGGSCDHRDTGVRESDTTALPIVAEPTKGHDVKPTFRIPRFSLAGIVFSRGPRASEPEKQTAMPPVPEAATESAAPVKRRALLTDNELLQLLETPDSEQSDTLREQLQPSPVIRPRPDSNTTLSQGDATGWRAWREPGEDQFTTILHVTGRCRLPSGSDGYRAVLQEAVVPNLGGRTWNSGGTDPTSSPILFLERIVAPPPFNSLNTRFAQIARVTQDPQDVLVTFTKVEKIVVDPDIEAGLNMWERRRRRHTHVTVIPEGITLRIQDC